jgi:hypothetical protein
VLTLAAGTRATAQRLQNSDFVTARNNAPGRCHETATAAETRFQLVTDR